MKKLLATNAMLVAVFFCGCLSPDTIEKDDILKVDNIEISNTKEATYTITSRDKYNLWKIKVEWTDSIGKFKVGDTVIIAKKYCH